VKSNKTKRNQWCVGVMNIFASWLTSAAKYTSGACGHARHDGGQGHICMHVWGCHVKQRGRVGSREESVAQFTSAAKYTSGACGNERHLGGKGHNIYMHVWDSESCPKKWKLVCAKEESVAGFTSAAKYTSGAYGNKGNLKDKVMSTWTCGGQSQV